MTYHAILLGMQVRIDPTEATKTILATYREAGANMCDAAERLGVSERTLHRYVTALDLKKMIGTIRERADAEGWLRSARWPQEKRKREAQEGHEAEEGESSMTKKTPPLSRVVYERSGAHWVASMPSIHGAYSQGRTRTEAYANLLDAVSELVKAHKDLAAIALARGTP